MAEGLRGLGHSVEVWNYCPSSNGFPVDRVFNLGRDPAGYIACLMEALAAEFDVFHFHGTRSLIAKRGSLPELLDLPVLRALGKRLVFTFHGSDIRLRSHHQADDRWSFYRFADIPCDEERIKQRLSIVTAYADHLTVCCSLDLPYAPGAVYVPKTVNLPAYRHVGLLREKRPVVLHATRRRETKGTDMIEAGVAALKSRGVPFEFRLIENASYAEVIAAIADADVVVEKLVNGDAGVLSLEALAMGKVAVARIRDEVRRHHPDMPVVSADPGTFVDVMTELLSSWPMRHDIASRGRPYVEANHSPSVAARRLEALYLTAKPKPQRSFPALQAVRE